MRHTIVVMTRGDAHRIAEWVDFHARLGFDDFQIVLDGDVDGTEQVLRSVDVPARVQVHRREERGEYHLGLPPTERQERVRQWRERHADELASGRMPGRDPQSWRQHTYFREVLAPYVAGRAGRGWVALLDVDEFLVLRQHDSVGALTAGQKVPRLRILDFNVDTTDHDPRLPVLGQHSVRWSREDVLAHEDPRWGRRVKSLVRYRVARLESTLHKVSRGKHAVLDPAVARIHHFKVPVEYGLTIPYTVDDPVSAAGAGSRSGPTATMGPWKDAGAG